VIGSKASMAEKYDKSAYERKEKGKKKEKVRRSPRETEGEK